VSDIHNEPNFKDSFTVKFFTTNNKKMLGLEPLIDGQEIEKDNLVQHADVERDRGGQIFVASGLQCTQSEGRRLRPRPAAASLQRAPQSPEISTDSAVQHLPLFPGC
jgi:hypothetical protein